MGKCGERIITSPTDVFYFTGNGELLKNFEQMTSEKIWILFVKIIILSFHVSLSKEEISKNYILYGNKEMSLFQCQILFFYILNGFYYETSLCFASSFKDMVEGTLGN
jgi:hypothetical protein